jgi:hypothetical protein
MRAFPACLAFMMLMACASGSNGPDADADQDTETEGESEFDMDVLPDEEEDAETEDVPVEGDDPQPDMDAEDPVTDDPQEEPDLADPCTPNPCTDPPDDECASATVLTQWNSPGACTPSGSSYTCEYSAADVDCADTSGMVCTGSVCTHTLEQVRAAPNGPVSYILRAVYVSYVKPAAASNNGFFIQRARTGPGLAMSTGSAAPTVDVGNLIEVEITNVSEITGVKTADAFNITANDGVTRDVSVLVQDFTGGGAIDESTESELIRIENALVVSGWLMEKLVTYGVSSSTLIAYDGFESFTPRVCPGMVIDIQAPAGERDGTYNLTPFARSDFLRADSTGCGAVDDSNWDFEDWTYADPPEDFEKMTSLFTAHEESTIVGSGSAGARLTWTSTDNQDFYQGWFAPVTSGTAYTFHVWTFDDDPGGRGRTAIQPYSATRTLLAKEYGSYTTDRAEWLELSQAFTPSETGFMRPFIRLYDVSTGWDGSASIILDDWALTVHASFNAADGIIDTWSATDPPSAPLAAGTSGVTMEIFAGLNDEGVLYAATNETSPGLSDHFLFIWIGAPHPTATIGMPWNKGGTVAAPGTGGAVFVLIQEETNGYCEVRRWSTSLSDWTTVTAACGYDGTAGGSNYVEAAVDLVSLLGLAEAGDLPAAFGFSVGPFGTGDGGALLSSEQVPACATCNGAIESAEVGLLHRAHILVGNLR